MWTAAVLFALVLFFFYFSVGAIALGLLKNRNARRVTPATRAVFDKVWGLNMSQMANMPFEEMTALADPNGLDKFDEVLWKHIGHSFRTMLRAWGRSWTGGLFAPAPDAGRAKPFYRQLSRFSAAFALSADMALLSMGGALKRREMISRRSVSYPI